MDITIILEIVESTWSFSIPKFDSGKDRKIVKTKSTILELKDLVKNRILLPKKPRCIFLFYTPEDPFHDLGTSRIV